jgi:predicted MFS family arabinose efflux permease
MMTFATVLALLTLTGVVHVWHIVTIAALAGIANSFDIPTRQSFTVEMVGRADLPRAITLNSIMFNSARLVGPALAGYVVVAVGEGWCFALNAASYLAVLTSLLMMRVTPQPAREPSHPLADLRDGFRYVSTHPEMRTMLVLLATASFFGASYLTLMPVFARDILGGTSRTLGLLMSGVGTGALVGAFVMSRVHAHHLRRVPVLSAVLFGTFLIAFSQSSSLMLSLFLLVPAGAGLMMQGISTNTIIQTVTSDTMRGRVMAYYVMSFMGMMPMGALAAGSLSHRIGVPETVALGGALCIVCAGIAFLASRRK